MSATPHAPQPPGALYVVPTPLDFGCDVQLQRPVTDSLPLATLQVAAKLTHWITENAKSTRAFLKRVDAVLPLAMPLQHMHWQELTRAMHKKGDHVTAPIAVKDVQQWLAPALSGHDIGLVSEAGMPAIADPGSSVVRTAHSMGLEVRVLSGPVSLVLALAGSGLNGQHFAFVGYLPQEVSARVARLRELEAVALRTGQTQLWIETPYRNGAMVQSTLSTLKPDTWLAVGCGLMVASGEEPRHPNRGHEEQRQRHSAPVSHWKKHPPRLDWSLPAVFMIGP